MADNKCKELKPDICGGLFAINYPLVCNDDVSNKVCEAVVCLSVCECE